MATRGDTFDDGTPAGLRRWLPIVLGALLAAGVAWWLYTQVTGAHGVKVEAPPPAVIDMLPPPPPPPPPPPEPQVKPPEPTDAPDPVPNPQPAKAPDAPAPMTIAGPAQAGSDSFGLAAGSGGGIGAPGGAGTCIGNNCGTGTGGGGGIGDGFYTRYLSSALQERVQDSDKVNRLVFAAGFAITIVAGRVASAQLVRSSGKPALDQQLKQILETTAGLDAPPAGWNGRAREITVRGRRAI